MNQNQLRTHFDRAFTMFDGNSDPQLFDQLLTAYRSPGRYYHTEYHLADCLEQFQRLRHLAQHSEEIEIAIWFHDAVYDSQRHDNEAQSAQWATQYLRSKNVDSACIDRISDFILATKTHESLNPDAQLLLDVDLSILAAPVETFDQYDRAIRQEYAWVSDEDYRLGRTRVLTRFLDRPLIYYSTEFRVKYEQQARSNLTRAWHQLTDISGE